MKRTKEKAPHIEVVSSPRGLKPMTAWDAESLMMMPEGRVFQLVPVTKRSDRQHRTYWKALGIVVKATEKWASAELLHRDLKMSLGYCEKSVNMRTGEVFLVPDSTALDKMDHDTFTHFFQQAMKLITEATGFDPLSFLDEER